MNRTSTYFMSFMALFASLTLIACTDENSDNTNDAGDNGSLPDASDTSDTNPEDLEDPTITMDGFTLYQTIAGTMDVEVTVADDMGVAQVDLIVAGEIAATATEEPFAIVWDSTGTDDGIVTVSAIVTDTAGKTAETDSIDVVVVNNGELVALYEGSTGKWEIPADYDGTQETHVKHHWDMGENGAARILVIVTYDEAWGQIGIDLGTGNCPHSGTKYDTGMGEDNPPAIFDSQPDGGYPASTLHFVHLFNDPAAHIGESVDYEVLVFTLFE